jgi:hypothetical protein
MYTTCSTYMCYQFCVQLLSMLATLVRARHDVLSRLQSPSVCLQVNEYALWASDLHLHIVLRVSCAHDVLQWFSSLVAHTQYGQMLETYEFNWYPILIVALSLCIHNKYLWVWWWFTLTHTDFASNTSSGVGFLSVFFAECEFNDWTGYCRSLVLISA